MLTVTLKLANPPAEGTGWFFLYGPVSPFADNVAKWKLSESAAVADPITVQMDEATRYIRVGVLAPPMGRTVYVFETTTPFVFKDKTTYIWDCATNSLSPETPEPVPERFIDKIFSFVWDISDFFYNIHLVVKDWIAPFNYLDVPILALYQVFFDLLTPISHFGDWIDGVTDTINKSFTWDAIKSAILDWLPGLEGAIAWFTDWWNNVLTRINGWWDATKLTVQGWIDTALQTAKDLVAGVQEELTDVHTTWSNFRTLTLPLLIRSYDAYKLIESRLKVWFPNYDDLVKLWADTKLFIATPLDWLLDKFTDWFLGKE